MAIRLTFDLTGVSSGIGECQLGWSSGVQKPNEGLAGWWCVCVCVCVLRAVWTVWIWMHAAQAPESPSRNRP